MLLPDWGGVASLLVASERSLAGRMHEVCTHGRLSAGTCHVLVQTVAL